MKRLARRAALSALILFAAAAAWTWRAWSPGAPSYQAAEPATPLAHRFRNGAEHDARLAAIANPYRLELATPNGALCYYGARHASDPDHPQVADIRARSRR